MSHFIFGLGNPGEEYSGTRHNAGVLALEALFRKFKSSPWRQNKKTSAAESLTEVGGAKTTLISSREFMNHSGRAIKPYIKTPKDLSRLLVIYDDLDLPLGRIKISYGRSSGGHKGLDSIIRALKSRDFCRLRVGISPATFSGRLKKPEGEKLVVDFILGKFSKKEKEVLEKVSKIICEAVETFVSEGRQAAMGKFNQA